MGDRGICSGRACLTLKGIIVAIVVSLITLAYKVADPPVYVLRRKPGTNVFRPQSPEHLRMKVSLAFSC